MLSSGRHDNCVVHQTSCVHRSCLLALPIFPESPQSVGAGGLVGTAIRGVVTWQALVCVAFVGFNTWPVMPHCWQPPSHDSHPFWDSPPTHACRAQPSTESLCTALSSLNLHTPPCTHNRPRSSRHEAYPPAPQLLSSSPRALHLTLSVVLS